MALEVGADRRLDLFRGDSADKPLDNRGLADRGRAQDDNLVMFLLSGR
jgi:hypothetical protein